MRVCHFHNFFVKWKIWVFFFLLVILVAGHASYDTIKSVTDGPITKYLIVWGVSSPLRRKLWSSRLPPVAYPADNSCKRWLSEREKEREFLRVSACGRKSWAHKRPPLKLVPQTRHIAALLQWTVPHMQLSDVGLLSQNRTFFFSLFMSHFTPSVCDLVTSSYLYTFCKVMNIGFDLWLTD